MERLSLSDLAPGDVVIRATYSSVNYKDALGVLGRAPIHSRHPLVPGIDVCGTVLESRDSRFQPGEAVLVTGCGLGERHDGGWAEQVRVPGDWVIRLPGGLGLWEAMALGTAGFTAALALERLESVGTHPALGPALVTGASGGVGSVAVDLLSKAGYCVTAVTGKPDRKNYLESLGAAEVWSPEDLQPGDRALEAPRWGAAVDTVGGPGLDWILRTLKPWCAAVAVGLPAGDRLQTSLMPLLLRGVSLLGVTASNCPMDLRRRVWERLAVELKPRHLETIACSTVPLEEAPEACQRLLERGNTGRIVVRLTGAPDER